MRKEARSNCFVGAMAHALGTRVSVGPIRDHPSGTESFVDFWSFRLKHVPLPKKLTKAECGLVASLFSAVAFDKLLELSTVEHQVLDTIQLIGAFSADGVKDVTSPSRRSTARL